VRAARLCVGKWEQRRAKESRPGTKFDLFSAFSLDRQQETVAHARKFARLMRAPLAFTSASHSINVQKLFKIVLSKRFNLKSNIPAMTQVGEPILEY